MSHEIQPDPSNHLHEHEPQATSKPMPTAIKLPHIPDIENDHVTVFVAYNGKWEYDRKEWFFENSKSSIMVVPKHITLSEITDILHQQLKVNKKFYRLKLEVHYRTGSSPWFPVIEIQNNQDLSVFISETSKTRLPLCVSQLDEKFANVVQYKISSGVDEEGLKVIQQWINQDDRQERKKHLEIYLPLYEASIRCDWKAAEAILDKKPDLVRCRISENGETTLHIAASSKAPQKKVDEFVRNLVERMELEDLELKNYNHSTALYLAAAAGNIETVKIMMENKSSLVTIPGGGGDMMPLYAAVLYGHKDVAEYLYERSGDLFLLSGWTDETRRSLLEKCVESDMFDIAIQILKRYPYFVYTTNSLGLLARKPEAFHEKKSSNAESNIIRRTIKSVSAFIGYKGTPVEKKDALALLRTLWKEIVELPRKYMADILRGPPDSIQKHSGSGRIVQTIQLKELIFCHFDKLVEEIQTIMNGTEQAPKLKDLVSKHVVNMHVKTQKLIKQDNTTDEDQALELQKLISEYIVKLHAIIKVEPPTGDVEKDNETAKKKFLFIFEQIREQIRDMRAKTEELYQKVCRRSHSSRVMFIAAEVGNTNFLVELISGHPYLIWEEDDNGLSIFHIAVKHRHEGIYNLLYGIGSMKNMVTLLKDRDGNNMLHLAAMSTRNKNLEDVSGAALRMQRELLWFEEVEHMIPSSSRVSRNKDGFTPRELFTMEHQYLIDQGEKWMKQTASQCMVVAALIATIVFAAAFTVPGGYNESDGFPIFKPKRSFVAFVVADAISLFLSSASILTFLSILTSRYAERDFVASLPRKLMLGLVTLFLSIGTMVVSFSISFFVLYHKEMKWIPIFISLFAVIPAILYVALQFHLLIDVFRSTYGGIYLFKPTRQVIFYENPTV